MLNRRRGAINPTTVVLVVALVIPILVSSSNLKDSNDLAFALIQLTGKYVISHSYFNGGGLNTSSGKVGMAPKFRTLGQKESKPVVDPPTV